MRAILQNTRNIDHVRFNLTLIRHAETHANADGVIQGSINTELSDIGYCQCQVLGRHLQAHRFSHVYSSDLKRAAETARQILEMNQVSTCKVQYDTLLRERTYGIAEGQTRQWLRELAKENGIPYASYTPPGAESTIQVRERVITFFRKLCDELVRKFGASSCSTSSALSTPLLKSYRSSSLSCSTSSEHLNVDQLTKHEPHRQRSSSTGDIAINTTVNMTTKISSHSSIDSALELSSLSSDQQSVSSTQSIISRNSSFEKNRNVFKSVLRSPYENNHSDLEVLIVSHGAVIRELIKYFACDLQTDIGQYFDTIQDIAPNTSITRFEVTHTANEDSNSTTALELVDYHNKTHLINVNNEELNLDVVNKCSF